MQRGKLGRILGRYGVVENIVVNEVTGHVLGGHQRLAWIDSRMKAKGEKDYSLPVGIVHLKTEQDELTLMAALNNPQAQGEYDLDMLHDQLKEKTLNAELAGFDKMWLELNFPDDPDLSNLFAESPGAVKRSAEKLSEIAAVTAADRRKWRENLKDEQLDPERFVVVLFDSGKARTATLRKLRLKVSERYFTFRDFSSALGSAQKRK